MQGLVPAPGPLADAYDIAAGVLPAEPADRPLDTDIETAARLLAAAPGAGDGPFLAELLP
jgi:histidine ammonia-lyase